MEQNVNKEFENRRAIADPSELTTLQLQREIELLEKYLLVRILANEEAVKIAHDDVVRVPTDVQKAVEGLKELHEKWFLEKFAGIEKLYTEKDASIEKLYDQKIASIEKQFYERDVRVEQAAKDRKATVDGELAAHEKASQKQFEYINSSITKNENATTKLIDQQRLLIEQNAKSLEGKIDDTKERLTTIEGIAVGSMNTKTTQQSSGGYTAMIVGLVISAVLGVVGIIISVMRST